MQLNLCTSEVLTTELQDEGVLSLEDASRARSAHRTSLDEALLAVDSWRPTASMLEGQWASCVWPASPEAHYVPETGVNIDTLKQVGHASVETPSGFVSLIPAISFQRTLKRTYRKYILGCNAMSSVVSKISKRGKHWTGLLRRHVLSLSF
jgi:2-oxoglutarate dehydrogenase complex dehydrogenase (E1) component-like enzyme